jgi:hypothetical protein
MPPGHKLTIPIEEVVVETSKRAQNPYAFPRPEHNLHFTEKI